MDTITDALMLKDSATRGQVALVYGGIGLLIGALVLGRN